MRIISGTARGRRIDAPKGMTTRPVTDMIRESLFNIWQFDIEGARFLDLFAGSGCMGLEALSRGAVSSVEVDASSDAIRVIRANLKNTGLAACPCEVLREDVFNVISRFGRCGRAFDIVYADPPFTQPEMFLPLMEALGNGALLAPAGSLVIRTEQRLELPDQVGRLTKVREKRYGISTVHFYEAVAEEPAAEKPCEEAPEA